jgi:hypothetical protein
MKTIISDYAFECCNSLTDVNIPNSVTTIGQGAFCECDSLTNVIIPNSVTSIGIGAFGTCTSLTSVIFGGTTAQWNAISKVDRWDYNAGAYTVYCTDGVVDKNGTVTLN